MSTITVLQPALDRALLGEFGIFPQIHGRPV
jgi:hypothetical protein